MRFLTLRRALPLLATLWLAGCAPTAPPAVTMPLDAQYQGALSHYFGVSGRSPAKASRGVLGLALENVEPGQVRITGVAKDLPGDMAGLRAGDVVVQMNGAPVSRSLMTRQIARQTGEPLRLLVSRDGFKREFRIAPVASAMTGPCAVADASAVEYRGECAKGLAHGQGRFFTADYVYLGELRDGLPNGQGQRIDKAGRYFEGAFRDGEYWGRGLLLLHPDGRKFEGEWKNGLLEGPAVFTAADGRTYQGTWVRGVNAELDRQLREEQEARETAQHIRQREAEKERADNFMAFMQGVLQVAGMAAEMENERLQAQADRAAFRQRMAAQQAEIQAAHREKQPEPRRPADVRVAQLVIPQRDQEAGLAERAAARRQEQAAAEQKRAREEAANERKQAKELAEQRRTDYLDKVRQATSLTVVRCQGRLALKGEVPRIRPKEAACLRLSYEVRCGADSSPFESGNTNVWIGYSCFGVGDLKFIQNPQSCAPEKMRVVVTDVDSCE